MLTYRINKNINEKRYQARNKLFRLYLIAPKDTTEY